MGMVIENSADLRKEWAEALSEALEAKKLTAKQFQRMLLAAGHDLSLTTVYNWLGGIYAPTAFHQAVISAVLAMPARCLFPLPSVLSSKGAVA